MEHSYPAEQKKTYYLLDTHIRLLTKNMTISSNSQEVRIKENEISNGHFIDFLLPVRRLVGLESKPFILEHRCNCRNLPTSWILRVSYEHEPDTGKVLCSVSFKRTDNMTGSVDVGVDLLYADKNDNTILYSESLFRKNVFSGDEVEGSIEDYRHPGYISFIYNLGLVLVLSVFIQHCHTAVKVYAKAGLNSENGKIMQSKL